MTMVPFIRKTPEENLAEDSFVTNARVRSKRDLEEVRGMRKDVSETSKKLQEQTERNHWAETIRRALGGT